MNYPSFRRMLVRFEESDYSGSRKDGDITVARSPDTGLNVDVLIGVTLLPPSPLSFIRATVL